MQQKELICIGCPLGCVITVEMEGEAVTDVKGNTCSRGKVYAEKEVTDPARIVTSTVKVSGGDRVSVSCKTKNDIPKEKIFDVVQALKELEIKAPVYIGDVILENAADTGVAIVATSNVHIKG
ncbi:MAG: DUF1667 domain-containing protein [Schaedlerella sp.]|nr:DUF1667 domain-containing protein [Schaedlerella sp.]